MCSWFWPGVIIEHPSKGHMDTASKPSTVLSLPCLLLPSQLLAEYEKLSKAFNKVANKKKPKPPPEPPASGQQGAFGHVLVSALTQTHSTCRR